MIKRVISKPVAIKKILLVYIVKSRNRKKIICIFSKKIQDNKYMKITYINSNYKYKILENKDIASKLDIVLLNELKK